MLATKLIGLLQAAVVAFGDETAIQVRIPSSDGHALESALTRVSFEGDFVGAAATVTLEGEED